MKLRSFLFLVAVILEWAVAEPKKGPDEIPKLQDIELETPAQKKNDPNFYRRLILNIKPKGEFVLRLPGQKPVAVNYQIGWDFEKLAKTIDPIIPKSDFIQWTDRVFTDDHSKLTIEGDDQIYPITCIYVDGSDSLSSKLLPFATRFALKVTLVVNDNDCVGPIITNPKVFIANKQAWSTQLQFDIRDVKQMIPLDPKLIFFRNEFSLLWEKK